jgi:hypothetical protein
MDELKSKRHHEYVKFRDDVSKNGAKIAYVNAIHKYLNSSEEMSQIILKMLCDMMKKTDNNTSFKECLQEYWKKNVFSQEQLERYRVLREKIN